MNNKHLFTFAACAALLAGCGTGMGGMGGMGGGSAAPQAVARLQPTAGNQVTGTATFTQRQGGVHVAGEVRGLKPNSEHGFHVHEKGDCSSRDATSAGGHFNPGGHPHGMPGHGAHHAGDMPNLKADAAGVARFDVTLPALSVASGANAVTGRGLVVHAGPDDYRSQPAGDSGPRLACAVITRA
ncbi:superoxide dismutase family protein [Ramlibacter rhizophilus]|uniref:Superoxide dismutase [Cu-Zn] n=1 Tax=Ramlibacter rhizophilus TaxID=1781167 RepID=A0A4Z0BQT4_9BURK|nr:superoxide dismutase family protein [Ramlibacter rhizophilus]TFZ01657.1 superoxide dismutase family protein [Ramlibacter rhizophilus]